MHSPHMQTRIQSLARFAHMHAPPASGQPSKPMEQYFAMRSTMVALLFVKMVKRHIASQMTRAHR